MTTETARITVGPGQTLELPADTPENARNALLRKFRAEQPTILPLTEPHTQPEGSNSAVTPPVIETSVGTATDLFAANAEGQGDVKPEVPTELVENNAPSTDEERIMRKAEQVFGPAASPTDHPEVIDGEVLGVHPASPPPSVRPAYEPAVADPIPTPPTSRALITLPKLLKLPWDGKPNGNGKEKKKKDERPWGQRAAEFLITFAARGQKSGEQLQQIGVDHAESVSTLQMFTDAIEVAKMLDPKFEELSFKDQLQGAKDVLAAAGDAAVDLQRKQSLIAAENSIQRTIADLERYAEMGWTQQMGALFSPRDNELITLISEQRRIGMNALAARMSEAEVQHGAQNRRAIAEADAYASQAGPRAALETWDQYWKKEEEKSHQRQVNEASRQRERETHLRTEAGEDWEKKIENASDALSKSFNGIKDWFLDENDGILVRLPEVAGGVISGIIEGTLTPKVAGIVAGGSIGAGVAYWALNSLQVTGNPQLIGIGLGAASLATLAGAFIPGRRRP